MGLTQGITELFPVSSLGHGVLLPGLLGWHNLVNSQSAQESFFLAFIVGLHVGTALGLLVYYRKTWIELFRGLGRQLAGTAMPASRRSGTSTIPTPIRTTGSCSCSPSQRCPSGSRDSCWNTNCASSSPSRSPRRSFSPSTASSCSSVNACAATGDATSGSRSSNDLAHWGLRHRLFADLRAPRRYLA